METIDFFHIWVYNVYVGLCFNYNMKGGENEMGLPTAELDAFNAKCIERISYSRNGDGFTAVAKMDGREVEVRLPLSPDSLRYIFDRRTVADGLVEILSRMGRIKFSQSQEGSQIIWIRV
ncbi:MAG: hypothetical protein HYT98_02535 [Candidatus Sungbacteria bacterium]|nr:hypothetical protein [Candidatus Sungbacteria bacterium]